jgi:hypothetical protein
MSAYELHTQYTAPRIFMTLTGALLCVARERRVWFQLERLSMKWSWFRWVEIRETIIYREESHLIARALSTTPN